MIQETLNYDIIAYDVKDVFDGGHYTAYKEPDGSVKAFCNNCGIRIAVFIIDRWFAGWTWKNGWRVSRNYLPGRCWRCGQ